ncbi:MAG: double-strand break repair helicase AddA [Alphaproteobacteria bacterium]
MSERQESTHLASDPRRSAWVSANAGSGKTHLLADRVTRLLLDGANPSRVLCLTYTKAAAAEMASRLYTRLGDWALLPDDELTRALKTIGAQDVSAQQLRDARRLFASALETPGGLKIQTIHSFCQHVLARFPVEAGISARFHVLDERSAAELMKRARNDVLSRAAQGDQHLKDAIAALAARAGDDRFAEILDAILGQERGKLRDAMERHGGHDKLCAAVRHTLNVGPDESPESIVGQFCRQMHGEKDRGLQVMTWLAEGSDTDRNHSDCLGEFLQSAANPDSIEALGKLFLKSDGTPRERLATRDLIGRNPANHEYLLQLQQRYLAMQQQFAAATTAVLTEAVVTLAGAVIDAYGALKRARSALDYDDLTRHALDLLDRRASAEWVLFKLDGGLDHILVDEAQDTSPQQWRIVAKLVEDFFSGAGTHSDKLPPTMFAVGDEKQSIFSFQGADPNAFAAHLRQFEERAKAARMAFEPVELQASYRGARDVLTFVDKVFKTDLARAGLSSSGGAIRHQAVRLEIPGRVEVWAPAKPDPTKASEAKSPVDAPEPDAAFKVLARQIADRIRRWLDAGLVLPVTKMPVQPGDIMILVRRRAALAEEIIRQLIDRDIRVAGADRMKLSEQIAIADLVALGRFALLPDDDLSLAALLKSPLMGVSEDELFELAHGRKGFLWNELKARKNEKKVFRRAFDTLTDALARADLVPPFEFYSAVLSRGVRRALAARTGGEASDAIDEFLALALAYESAHAPNLEGFLHWFGSGASEVKRDMEYGGNAVRVMTVHGAKGLQAPIVIVPDTTQIPFESRNDCILYHQGLPFFGVRKNLETPVIAQARADAHDAEMHEYGRLLYVALTRAQDWLVVCGYETKLRPPITPRSWYAHVRDAARAVCREEKDIAGESILVYGDSLDKFARAIPDNSVAQSPLPDFLFRAAAPEKIVQRVLQPSQLTEAEDPPVFSPFAEDGQRFRHGLLVHALLAMLPALAPQAREAAGLRYLAGKGVESEERAQIVKETLAVLNAPEFAGLFVPESRAEVPLSVDLPEIGPGVRVSGQVDRLAVTSDSVLIADYKTNRPPPARVEDVPSLYRTQMALYRAALKKIYPQKRIACALVWTDGPRLMTLPEPLLDAETQQITRRFMDMATP